MCGICGLWSEGEVDGELLRRMAQLIHHRGPDDKGFYLGAGVGLANVRLSIIDLNTGKQPIANEDESVWIVFNGEIYNYPELRRELLGRGHHFKTHTDTEVIVHLYEEYGLDCVRRLRGMFAFALWDERKRRLLLARDPLGQKPLYYSRRPGEFLFGSEIKALLAHRGIRPRLNKQAMHNYISLRYLPDADTMFEGIEKVPAGHFLTVRNGQVDVRPYWDVRYVPKLAGSEAEIKAQVRQQLLDTVQCHLLSDVPLGAFLSGGIDSTLITALMCKLSPERIKTFSIGVQAEDFNELPYARMVAERYGTEHYEYTVEADLVSTLPAMLWHIEEPVDPFAFGVYTVARLASQHVKVALGGDGGDEMFAGYDRYLGNQLIDLYCLIPAPLRRHLIEPIIQRLPDNFSYNNRVQKLRWMMALSKTSVSERYAASASFLRFSHVHKEALYTSRLWQELGEQDSAGHLMRFFDAGNAQQAVDKMLYTDLKTRLPDHLLMIADRMTMAHSLEGRSPYVDHRLVEFVATVPAEYKLRGRTLKYLQREIAREFLPETLVQRPKQGFSFPLAYWFKQELRPLTTTLFQQSRLVEEGYFQAPAMLGLLEEHVEGKVDHNYRLWLLLNLELWHRLFVEGQSADELNDLLCTSTNQHRVQHTMYSNGREHKEQIGIPTV